ncbi:MAG: hypothetical protein Q8N99_01970 [Nanoarchaeota archaeon]|nr:hypothetical protein [Nanoarchaeota archaeon]
MIKGKNQMLEKLKKAKPHELLSWMFGVGILGFGLGMLLSDYKNQLMIFAILLGAVMYGWAMYRIYSRK